LPPGHDFSEYIVKALKQCIAEHAVLSTAVVDAETEQPKLVKTPGPIDVKEHVKILDKSLVDVTLEKTIQNFLLHAHNDPLPRLEEQPAWRVYVLSTNVKGQPGFHLAFSSSHALVDGRSGFVFHRSFLNAFRKVKDLPFDSTWTFEPESTAEILRSMEKIANLSISWSYLLRPLLGEYLPPFLSRALGVVADTPGATWCGAPQRTQMPEPAQLVTTALRMKSITGPTVKQVLDVARKHESRLTGLIIRLVCRALVKCLDSHGRAYDTFNVDTAIDLRSCMPSAKDIMGCFPSALEEAITVSTKVDLPLGDEDWNSARHLTSRLAQASNTRADQPVGLLRYLIDYRQWTLKKASNPPDSSFGMSNLGVFDGTADGMEKWQVTDMVFSQSADAAGTPFNVNIASAKGGSLNIGISWWPGMLGVDNENKFVEEVLEDVSSQLEGLVSS
jgi:hypothetical protein